MEGPRRVLLYLTEAILFDLLLGLWLRGLTDRRWRAADMSRLELN